MEKNLSLLSYEPPLVEVVEINVEKGFAATGGVDTGGDGEDIPMESNFSW